ncbi:MAG: [protein-PII] uridylyltransferase family protein [Terriglobales bacterium]
MAESSTDSAKVAAIAFRDRERALVEFERVRSQLPETLSSAVLALLADLPRPDAALSSFERLIEVSGQEVIRLIRQHGSLLHYALAVFSYSQYLGETLLQNTDVLQNLMREQNIDRSHSHEEFREAFARFRSRSFETDIALLLARFKRREYIRIMLRDVLGFATLADTTAEISALSDVLIEEALRECETEMRRKFGLPQHRDRENRLVQTPFAVVALGKLGGKELNYSSDIDLFFVYGDGVADDDAPLTNREYFVRLAQQVTNVLSRVTPEGFVFRIDLRLRPQGREGEAAISLSHALRYYADKAHDWERQAMIKARPAAGDVKPARQLIRGLQEHIYTEAVNFTAIETALDSLDRIRDRRIAKTDGSVDVKLDRGGIRDIEFLVQCLQRVYGGKERWLRSGGTLFSLQKLHDKRHISGSDFHHLTTTYEFLRCIEHRLQLWRGQQTHRIPADADEQETLARSLPRPGAEPYTGQELMAVVRERMVNVREIYSRIIHQQQQRSEQQVSAGFELSAADVEFGRVPSDQQVLQRLAVDAPVFYQIAARSDLEPHTRRNLFKFLSSAFTSAERYRAVTQAPEEVEHALELFRTSEFVTDILVRHPEDVASLKELRASSSRHQSETLFATDDVVRGGHSAGLEEYLASDELGWSEKMALLRRRFRYRMFLSAARDVLQARPVFASLRDTTSAAEEAIAAAWVMAGRPEGMAVLALGRLGSGEFDVLSDADLIFVRDNSVSGEDATRAAEDIVQVLSAYTNEGTVLSVDLRLRPHGGEGEMVSSLDNLEVYCESQALPWEALTYAKLRRIAGSEAVASKASAAAGVLKNRFAADASFPIAVREMRAKLQDTEEGLKTAAGGMYDIDFLAAYTIIRHGVHTAEGAAGERLQKLHHAGLISKPDLQLLLDALELYRTTEHAIRLVTGRAGKVVPVYEAALANVTELTCRMSTRQISRPLDEELAWARARVRGVFDRSIR